MLGRVAVEVVDPEGADARRERARGVRVGAALPPPAADTASGLGRPRGALFVVRVLPVGPAHLAVPVVAPGGEGPGLAEGVLLLRRVHGARAGALPLVRVADALALGGTEIGRLSRGHVDHGLLAGDVGELERIDAHPRVGRALAGLRVVERHHVLAVAGRVRLGPRGLPRRGPWWHSLRFIP